MQDEMIEEEIRVYRFWRFMLVREKNYGGIRFFTLSFAGGKLFTFTS